MRFKAGDKLIRRSDDKIYTVLSIESCGIKGFPYYKCSADDTHDANPVYLNDTWVEAAWHAIGCTFTAQIETTCECGMEKHGFANHSTWCAKYGS